MPQTETASGDPAMAFEPSIERTGDHSTRLPKSAAVALPAERRIYPGIRFKTREHAAHKPSTANTQPFDQRLVTRCVDTGEVVEKLATLGHELEQSTPGMVVLDVGLEMLGKAVDAFREDRHLYFRRSGITGLDRVALDEFGLPTGRYRHRVVFLILFGSPVGGRAGMSSSAVITSRYAGQCPRKRGNIAKCAAMPVEIAAGYGRKEPRASAQRPVEALSRCARRAAELKMRRGRNSPFSTSASATSAPRDETETQPPMTGASRPRSSTAWPRASRPASLGLTCSVGKAASPASTGRSTGPSTAAVSAARRRCNLSRLRATSSPKGPTPVR